MEAVDLALRQLTYAMFVRLGRAPTAVEVSSEANMEVASVRHGWARLHDSHALVLNQSATEIRMANPFSAVPTAYRVQARGRCWYANCAWDAFGICAALHVDGTIETSCPDCGESVGLAVMDERPSDETLVFHCLVPARDWWEDIAFT